MDHGIDRLSSRKCYLTKYHPSSHVEEKDDGLPLELKENTNIGTE